ncbi:DUF3040 domain-containing protein [Streptomonospora litoralis]|uniref:DUF3040 domain-containing protein n=1 Tax=Streptomonospora litoralis TaxID=2498135 RepID=A0A4P6Q1K4_9ACTN|nr:DUF3040 domain-containing protein [Streptomonospora litoralis]QBI54516.1 hypothetical protein EKD16_13670 [Streptomonospora litoralis]
MALDRRDEARLHRLQRQLAADDPDCHRRMRDYSDRLARNRAATAEPAGPAEPTAAREPAPWAGVLLVWAVVLAAALVLIAATAGTA